MPAFSIASVTSTCAAISHRALSTAVEIDELCKESPSGDDVPSERLAFLATKLRQFRQHADILQESLGDASVISPGLQETVLRSLAQCDRASAILEKQVKRLHPLTLGRLHSETLSLFEGLLVTSSRVFIFVAQLLSVLVARPVPESKCPSPPSNVACRV